jgi:hypothetical protein
MKKNGFWRGFKYTIAFFLMIAVLLIFGYGVIYLGAKLSYKMFYEDMVKDTIKESKGDKIKNDSKNEMQNMQIRVRI